MKCEGCAAVNLDYEDPASAEDDTPSLWIGFAWALISLACGLCILVSVIRGYSVGPICGIVILLGGPLSYICAIVNVAMQGRRKADSKMLILLASIVATTCVWGLLASLLYFET